MPPAPGLGRRSTGRRARRGVGSGAGVLGDLEVGRRTEAPQVVGDLHGAVVGAEQVEQDRDPAAGEAGGVGPAEVLLESGGQDVCAVGRVGQPDPAAARDCDRLGRLLVEQTAEGVRQPAPQERDEREPRGSPEDLLVRAASASIRIGMDTA